ncbi:MAG TPA: translation elongation factor Ts [Mycobacteriales bacterium]|nr:translation elongation factor Ts [Mycobacteriales bacterium]
MADISVAAIKRVREITGAGMSDVKAALVAADGDEQTAIDELRKKGAAKAVKRGAERVASNGIVAGAEGALIELACETDFVAKNEQVQQLAADIVAYAAKSGVGTLDALLGETLADGVTVATSIEQLAAAMGEKMELRRVAYFDGKVASYLHRRATDLPPQIGVLVEFTGDGDDAAEVARGAAMQVASLRAQYVTREQVPAEVVAKEREIAESIAKEEGKPEAALPKIVEGRVQGFYKEVVLTEQASVRDSKKSVKAVLAEAGVTVTRFVRFEVGEALDQ